jgi:prepilin-type N-terminal cleavage/methylation domain-containing protein
MKTRHQNGFTLIELTLVLGISVMVASALIGMFQAHVQMLTQAAKYKFLAQDAPFIGLLLTRTIGNAEDYRIYGTGSAARSNSSPALTGQAVRLWMRQPNSTSTNTFRLAVVSYETVNSHPGIYFFLADSTGTFSATPNWELAGGQLTAATFAFDTTTGVLLSTLTGTYNDQYIFSAEKK